MTYCGSFELMTRWRPASSSGGHDKRPVCCGLRDGTYYLWVDKVKVWGFRDFPEVWDLDCPEVALSARRHRNGMTWGDLAFEPKPVLMSNCSFLKLVYNSADVFSYPRRTYIFLLQLYPYRKRIETFNMRNRGSLRFLKFDMVPWVCIKGNQCSAHRKPGWDLCFI
jgi:hypothetical protein